MTRCRYLRTDFLWRKEKQKVGRKRVHAINARVTISKNRAVTTGISYRDHFLIGKDAIHLRNENSDILPGARSWPTYEYLFEYDFRTFLQDCIFADWGHLLFVIFTLILVCSLYRGYTKRYFTKQLCPTPMKSRNIVCEPKWKSFVVWENLLTLNVQFEVKRIYLVRILPANFGQWHSFNNRRNSTRHVKWNFHRMWFLFFAWNNY